ncbi:hypothetical protein, partial [Klebsiella variicola]|uniref:hypothetical protein n=1 Tax=Klebsiella variicola TaxID=244366 RepID=UPI0028F8AF78
ARFMNSFLHQASFATGYWYYDRHRSVRLVVLVGLAIDQIAQSGLSSLSVIYYSAQLFRGSIPIQLPSSIFRTLINPCPKRKFSTSLSLLPSKAITKIAPD